MKTYIDLIQGTEEWKNVRRGVITGTDVGEFCLDPIGINMTIPEIKLVLDSCGTDYKKSSNKETLIELLPDKGAHLMELTEPAFNLLHAKIDDMMPKDAWRIEQDEKDEQKMKFNLPVQRGSALEPIAREYYSKRIGREVVEIGFVSSDCGEYGMSPDGVLMNNGKITRVLEIKNPWPVQHRKWLMKHHGKGTIPAVHFWQCQMGMVCCECDEVDFLSYCPGEAPLLVTLFRSDTTDQLEAGLKRLVAEKRKIKAKLGALWAAEKERGIA